jgi:hypothetical protein
MLNERQKKLGWQRWLILVAFLAVVGFTGLQTVRTVRHMNHTQFRRDEEIHGWMTIGYLAHSYRVPPEVLKAAVGLPDSPPDTRPLAEIAKAQGRSLDELSTSLQEAIARARFSQEGGQP